MAGNPADGITLWGVFPTAEQANEWAEQQRWVDAWYCVPIMATADDVPLLERAQLIVGRLKVMGVGGDEPIAGSDAVDELNEIFEDLAPLVTT
jgi:hypothetical protein